MAYGLSTLNGTRRLHCWLVCESLNDASENTEISLYLSEFVHGFAAYQTDMHKKR